MLQKLLKTVGRPFKNEEIHRVKSFLQTVGSRNTLCISLGISPKTLLKLDKEEETSFRDLDLLAVKKRAFAYRFETRSTDITF